MDTHRRRSSHNGQSANGANGSAASPPQNNENNHSYETQSPSPTGIYSGVDLARLAAGQQQQQQQLQQLQQQQQHHLAAVAIAAAAAKQPIPTEQLKMKMDEKKFSAAIQQQLGKKIYYTKTSQEYKLNEWMNEWKCIFSLVIQLQ